MLSIKGIHVFYENIESLKGVSFEVEKGSIVTLIGANGAGKTTTLMAISGLLKPKQGEIIFDGKKIGRLAPHEIVRQGISQVPEGRRVFPGLRVDENLEMGAFLRKDKKELEASLEGAFELFPILSDRRKQLAGTLSGGEQQMLAIARALMAKPKLLLLDEPSLGLAPKIVEKIFDAITKINKSGTTILLVEQNAHMALEFSSYGYVLETGRIILKDHSKNLLNNDIVKKAYLGE